MELDGVDAAIAKALSPALSKEGRYGPLLAATARAGDIGSDELGQGWAFLGDEERALAAWSARGRPTIATARDVAEAQERIVELVDAVEAVAQAAHGRQVVILNEDHNRSRHRAFMGLLAARLRRDGFDLLAAETFSKTASDLKAGDPVTCTTGFYTNDPAYAEAVRDALGLGYGLTPYERAPDQPALPGETGLAPRERIQAENLIAALKQRPSSRVLVHSGEGHGMRTEFGAGVLSFGLQLNRLLGAQALMVDQTFLAPRARPQTDPALQQAAQLKGASRRAVVAKDAHGGWVTGGLGAKVDLAVISPRLPPRHGRPGWLFDRPARQAAVVSLPARSEPWALVQAVPLQELGRSPLTVPADQLPITMATREVSLSLRPGRYRLRLETPQGRMDLRDLTV